MDIGQNVPKYTISGHCVTLSPCYQLIWSNSTANTMENIFKSVESFNFTKICFSKLQGPYIFVPKIINLVQIFPKYTIFWYCVTLSAYYDIYWTIKTLKMIGMAI